MYIIPRLLLIVKNYFRQAQKNPTKRITCWAQKVGFKNTGFDPTLFDVLVYLEWFVSSSTTFGLPTWFLTN